MSNATSAKSLAKPAAAIPAKPQGEVRRVISILNRFLIGNRGIFLLAMVMLIAESATSLAAKYPLAYLVDYLSGEQPELLAGLGLGGLSPRAVTLAALTLAIIGFAILNSISDSLSEIYLSSGGRRLGLNLRAALYAHLQKLSLAFYSKQRTGDLLSRVTGDVTALEEFATKSLKDIAGSIFILVLSVGALLSSSWQIALVALVMVPVMSVVSNYFADRIKAAAKKLRAREGELAAGAQEMLTSIRVIQTYGSGGNQVKRFTDLSRQTMETALHTARLQAWFSGIFNVLQAITIVLVVLVGVWLVDSNTITLGALVFFIGVIQDMFKPTKRIIKQWNEVGKIIASVERISEVLDRKPAVEDQPGAIAAPPFKGQVEFRNVSFAYQVDPEDSAGGEAPQLRLALRDINFTIAPGEVVALVGGSGAGKSTVVQLLPRLYDPHMGQVMIDGQDIRTYTLDSLRSRMSMVLQEAILFVGSVADNIAYGRPDATREEVIAAAIQASAHEFIEKLPEGYDTILSERASNLSGGQRQRIAIARAFIRNTPVLILDEPTTGLDAESTDLVLLALRSLMKGKATVIISHDLNLIRQADKIVVIAAGAIAQVGTHRALLKSGGLYADLYHKQFGRAVKEQGGAIEPPAPVEDDEDAPPVSAKVFQTLMTRALPQPVTSQAFQTMMMPTLRPPERSAEPAQTPAASHATPGSSSAASGVSPVASGTSPVASAVSLATSAKTAQPAADNAQPPAVSPVTSAHTAQPSAASSAPSAKTAQPAADNAQPPAVSPATSAKTAQPAAGTAQPSAVSPDASGTPAGTATPDAAKPAPPARSKSFETVMMRLPTEEAPLAAGPPTIQMRAVGQPPVPPESTPVAPTPAPGALETPPPVPLAAHEFDPTDSPVLRRELPSLQTAHDPQAMQEYLQAALFGRSNPNYTIVECTPAEAAYLPEEIYLLRYNLVVRDRRAGRTFPAIISARLFPNQLDGAVYLRDRLAPVAALMRGRPEVAPFITSVTLLEPLNMVIHVFPIDGDLPTLAAATDGRRMAEVLSELLPDGQDEGFTIEQCRFELVDYARRQHCTLRYLLDGRRPGGQIEHRTLYGKVFVDGSGAGSGPVTEALRAWMSPDDGRPFNIPRTLGWRPDLRLAVQETIPGTPVIADILKERMRGQDTSVTQGLEVLFETCGRLAAALHSSPVTLGQRRTLDDDLAALREELAPILRISPGLGARLQERLEQIETYAEQSDTLRPCFSHGDFTYGQVIFDGDTAGLVNFDSVCQAEPALDLGHFLAYLRIAGRKGDPATAKALSDQLSERFLNAYIAAMGARIEDAERLRVRIAVYMVASLLRRTVRSWQKFKGGRTENALALLEEELSCLPQLDY